MVTVDVWAQQPNERFMAQPWLETLLRWTGIDRSVPPVESLLAAMDAGGIDRALLSGWHGPAGPLISNDEVAAVVATHSDRFAGLATVDLTRPMDAVRVLLDFPDLVVVGGHVGFPWIDEVLSLAMKDPNFHVDTSAYAVHRLPPALVDYLRGPGRTRVLFGTNWPMLSPERALAKLDTLGLDDEARALFLGGNAERIFFSG